MAKHTKSARAATRARINARIRDESKRTGEDLSKRKPPAPIKRGTYAEPKKKASTTGRKASVSVKPKGILDVLKGETARKREEKATQPNKEKKESPPKEKKVESPKKKKATQPRKRR